MKRQHTALTRSTQAVSPRDTDKDEGLGAKPSSKHRILWVDGVGGFLMVDKEEIVIGQATSSSKAEVAIVGDLSRQAAAIRRTESDYLLQPLQPTQVDGVSIDRPLLLSQPAVIQLGQRVQLEFTKPSPLSATGCLRLASMNRFKPNVDGILLLADSCIIGPNPGSHVSCPNWSKELLLFRNGEQWYFRTLDEVLVNGSPDKGQILVEPGLRIQGEDFSLSVE